MHTHIRSKAIGYYLRQLLFKADSEKKGIVADIAISENVVPYTLPIIIVPIVGGRGRGGGFGGGNFGGGFGGGLSGRGGSTSGW